MDEEHTVPQLKVEAVIALPLFNFPVPRALAVLIAVGVMLLVFVGGQKWIPAEVLVQWVLPAFIAVALAYYFVRPENLTLSAWVGVLWEYIMLPRYAAWEPSAPTEAEEGPARRGGGALEDLWRRR